MLAVCTAPSAAETLPSRLSVDVDWTASYLTRLPACLQTIREAAAKAAQNPLPGEAEVTALDTPGGPLGTEGADTQREFDEQAASAVARYVDDALQRHFGSLVSPDQSWLLVNGHGAVPSSPPLTAAAQQCWQDASQLPAS